MGILPLGHIVRIIASLNDSNRLSSASTVSQTASSRTPNQIEDIDQLLGSCSSNNKEDDENEERKKLLMDDYISFSAHYLGSMEISNVEGAEDCRRAMLISKV